MRGLVDPMKLVRNFDVIVSPGRTSALFAILFSTAAAAVLAEESAGSQSLEQAASDPTASLMNVQIGDWYTESYWNTPGDPHGNLINLRSAYPFSWGNSNHILRATVPILTESPSGESGLADTTVFDLITFDMPWGRWGAGAVAVLPTGGEKRGAEKWGLGPAVGFVARAPGIMYGLFNQNVFTVAGEDDRDDVNVSAIQPIVNVQLGNGWAVGASEMNVTWNWETSEWSSLPLGFALIRMTRPGGLPVQWNAQYEYNFADDQVVGRQTFRVTAKLLFPTK